MAEWKPVVGFEGMYEVSSEGELRSLFRSTCRPMWTQLDMKGYVSVRLCGPKRSFFKRRRVHSLVLEAFVCPRPPGMQCRHINGDKRDNRLANLAWGTQKENAADSVRHGVFKKPAYMESIKKARAAATAARVATTECHMGHELTGDNAYVRPGGRISCRACQRLFKKKYKARKRADRIAATARQEAANSRPT